MARGHCGILLPVTACDVTNPTHFAKVPPEILKMPDVMHLIFHGIQRVSILQLSASVDV